MEFKEEEVVTKKSTIDVQSGEVHKVTEKDNTVSVVFQEEKNDVLMKCVINLTKDQLAHINREHNIKPLAKEQLQAIHAKNDAAEIKEAALVPADPVVEITIPAKLNSPVKHLPTETYPPLNWKDKNCNLAHFLKTYLPNNNGMDFQTARRIYLAQTYKDITESYRSQWVALVQDLDTRGYHNEVPDYLRKHYKC